MRGVRDGVVLGLLVTWQAFLNEELLFQTGLAVAVFVAAYAVFRPAQVRARAGPFLAGLGPALLTAGVLLAYPLWFQFFGPQSYRALPASVLGYGTDLRAFAAFAQLSLVRHGASHSSYGAPPEENTFFGAPLLIATGLIVVWLWRRRVAVRALTAVALVFFLLSLGRTVVVGGRVVLARGPMSLLGNLPVFDSAIPTRFGLALIPVVAILLAFSVCAAASAPAAWLRYGWPLALAAVLLPIAPTPVLAKPAAPVPAFFTSGQWRQYVHGDQTVYPADASLGRLVHLDGRRQRDRAGIPDGRRVLPRPASKRPGGLRPAAARHRRSGRSIVYYYPDQQITSAERAAFRADMAYWDTAIVVLTPDAERHDQLRRAFDQLTGHPARQVGGVLLWDVRASPAKRFHPPGPARPQPGRGPGREAEEAAPWSTGVPAPPVGVIQPPIPLMSVIASAANAKNLRSACAASKQMRPAAFQAVPKKAREAL